MLAAAVLFKGKEGRTEITMTKFSRCLHSLQLPGLGAPDGLPVPRTLGAKHRTPRRSLPDTQPSGVRARAQCGQCHLSVWSVSLSMWSVSVIVYVESWKLLMMFDIATAMGDSAIWGARNAFRQVCHRCSTVRHRLHAGWNWLRCWRTRERTGQQGTVLSAWRRLHLLRGQWFVEAGL